MEGLFIFNKINFIGKKLAGYFKKHLKISRIVEILFNIRQLFA